MSDSDSRLQYSQIESQLDTGDLFTFHGTEPLDFLIEMGEGDKPYSHVAMVLKYEGELYLWDAPGIGPTFPGPFITLLTPDPNPGCRVAKIRDVMAFYMSSFPNQEFFWRPLVSKLTDDQYGKLLTFIQEVNGTSFPNAGIPGIPLIDNLGFGLLKSYFDGRVLGRLVTGSYYCAQLIADTYLHTELLDPNGAENAGIPNAYTPADFDSTDSTELPLTPNTQLGEVQLAHYDLVVDLAQPASAGG